jgi:hypothetical protein
MSNEQKYFHEVTQRGEAAGRRPDEAETAAVCQEKAGGRRGSAQQTRHGLLQHFQGGGFFQGGDVMLSNKVQMLAVVGSSKKEKVFQLIC